MCYLRVDAIGSDQLDQHLQVGIFGVLFDFDESINFAGAWIGFPVIQTDRVVRNFDDFLRRNREKSAKNSS